MWILDQRDVFVSVVSLQAETEGWFPNMIKAANGMCGRTGVCPVLLLAISGRLAPAFYSLVSSPFYSPPLCICYCLAVSVCVRPTSLLNRLLVNVDRTPKSHRRYFLRALRSVLSTVQRPMVQHIPSTLLDEKQKEMVLSGVGGIRLFLQFPRHGLSDMKHVFTGGNPTAG